ncbi:unnamed protein product [marine sediment metagenome]|uniref:Uncharacterized protein n=1 Tax=marine sediment metagenome TaxID=412755 RepID=X0TV57_9ZZZZ
MEADEGENYCPACGQRLSEGGEGRVRRLSDRRAVDHLSLGFNLAMARPMVFAPVLLGGIISIVIDNFGGGTGPPSFAPILFFASIVSMVGSIITFVLNFATVDMARDAYMNQPLDLGRSFNYALGRIVTFFFASIVRVLMSLTIILIPAASLMTVIIVMDETGIMNAISQAFSVLTRDLGDVIIIVVVSIVGYVLLGWAPMVGGLLTACFGVIIDLAFIDVYHHYKKEYLAF